MLLDLSVQSRVIVEAYHTENNGTNGQDFTSSAGSRVTCTLNTLGTNTNSLTLSSNAIQSVPAGLYACSAGVCMGDAATSTSALKEVYINDGSSDLTTLDCGIADGSAGGGAVYPSGVLASIRIYMRTFSGYLRVPTTSNLTLQVWCHSADQPLAYQDASGDRERYHYLKLVQIGTV